MEGLGKLEEDRRAGRLPGPVRRRGIASDEMCTFLIPTADPGECDRLPESVWERGSGGGGGSGDRGDGGEYGGGGDIL